MCGQKTEEDATEMTARHYMRPEIRDTIMRIATDGNMSRAGNGNFAEWYKYGRRSKSHYDLSNASDYNRLVARYKSLYWTLNIFDSNLYTLNYIQSLPETERIPKTNSTRISRENTRSYSMAVDIDKAKGTDIHDPTVIKAIEDMAQFYADEFRKHAPNSVYAAFSGGGIHVYVHHRVFTPFFQQFEIPSQIDAGMQVLCNIFDLYLDDIRKRFFDKYPEHEGQAKPDSLNNSKRLFKTLFSIHRRLPYVVIPLDVDKIKIDFSKAKLPLKQDIIDAGKAWYIEYDTDNEFLINLKQYEKAATTKQQKKEYVQSVPMGDGEPLRDMSQYPPCIRNIFNHPTGSTRALRVVASFLGDMRVPAQEASDIFYNLASKWNAETSNIFETSYGKLHTPQCVKLNDPIDTGFPHGNSIKSLCVCVPDVRCLQIDRTNPRYYTDRKANLGRLAWIISNDPAEVAQ